MKIQLAPNSNLSSNNTKGTTYGILLFVLAFVVPSFAYTQDKPIVTKTIQASPTTAPQVASQRTVLKETSPKATKETVPATEVTDVKVAADGEKTTITITADQPITHRKFVLENPRRLVLDFPNAYNNTKTALIPVGIASVKQLRIQQFQQFPSPIVRLVLDLETESKTPEITVDKNVTRIIFLKGQTDSTTPSKLSSKPQKARFSAREIPAQPPLIASLAPSAIPVSRNESAPSFRFSGQPLTLDLVNVPLVDFFRLMAEEGGINIVLDPSVKGTISIKVVKMPWDQIFEVALLNNGLDKQVEGTLVRIARLATLQDEAKQQESLKKATLLAADLETRIKRLNYTKATEMKNVLIDQKTVRGTVVVDERTNSLILTDLPFSLQKQIQLIESLDIAQPQVEIEARIVSASRNFSRDIGIQFGFLQGNNKRVSVGGANTGAGLDGTRPSVIPSVSGNGAVSAGNTGNYNVNLPAVAAFGGLGVAVGNIMDTFMLDAAITAGESKGWAKLISQPKVTAQNNNQAVVTQGFRFPVTVNSNNTVTVQFFDAALTLTATPQITYDGNIVLDLKVVNNSLDFSKSVNNIPSIRTSESSTRVLITNGATTVISGIIIENDGNSEDRVPGLGSIPLIKNLFRRSSVLKESQEILFFVTPRIVK